MTMKEGFFFVWLLLAVASSFFFSHFWSYAIYMVQKAVAFGVLPLLLFSKLVAEIAGLHLLV